ncbi:MAG: penicillin-binding protein 2 [Anaerolineae bacterium]|nr:penicillin-binding protein 2 [Anaerolineae bacterium]
MDTAQPLLQKRRLVWLAGVLATAGVFLLVRLAWWQLTPRVELPFPMESQPDRMRAARGNIFDATGHLIVASTLEYEVGVSPKLLSEAQRKELAPQLAAILGRDVAQVADILAQREAEYMLLGRNLPAHVGRQIEELEAEAFSIEVSFRRVYPDGSLAASVLGFIDGDEQGQYGLERYYDRALRGVDGRWYGVRDSWGELIMMSVSGYQPVEDGADLVLTLDRNVQAAAERILLEGIQHNKATAGNVLVLDADTGAVLAMANYPTYDPGRYGEVESLEHFINTSVSALYEPGSVLKPLTLAAALEAKVIRATDTYDDRGEIIVGEQRIMNSDRRAHGLTTMTQILEKSLNVGAAHVATLLGPTRFYEMMRRFGLGEATGIDLALEVPGLMRVPGDSTWHMSDMGTNSFGQGISVTPIQVASAYVALANEGMLMRPYLVSAFRSAKGEQSVSPFPLRQAVSPEVAETVTAMLVEALEKGMQRAVVPGYRFAGKSGTAGIPDQEGYRTDDIIASFVGYGPMPDPRFVILVRFDRPREGYWGVEVAAPEFSKLATFLVDYYGIPPGAS